MPLLEILNEYGFATMAAIAMGWFIWFIYTFITQEVTKKLGEASAALRSSRDPQVGELTLEAVAENLAKFRWTAGGGFSRFHSSKLYGAYGSRSGPPKQAGLPRPWFEGSGYTRRCQGGDISAVR